ncbi:MAG: calcium-translocating P-type ATPase, PMCA-type [Bacillota bacterium]|nr:calcium-translocating P-type ATPase, PMCA-type [Bacillota bacterium]MDD3297745.1 calcium-translocating P-type ATPase, PMCA-type [Bacillota bacterium]MDD3850080.1 calcium-translocating P-type ATPase, PMCA-type [Bacillota bacterium]MDD4706682.1 calcium-translocating P-type ATPase, PMCA-type [Bacillota bacterium]
MVNGEWYTLKKETVENKLSTSLTKGLSREETDKRLEQYGYNEIAQKDRKTLFQMYADQFKDFMIIILIVAAVISGLLGEFTDAIIILLIVILNAVMGVVQENKAEESLAALKRMAAPNAKVLRDGRHDIVSARQLVPGDVIILETGDLVPADIRITAATNLKIQEAALTGESVPVEKDIKPLAQKNIPLGDRVNMGYSGSIVTYGRGSGIVVGTGMETEVGKIAEMIQSAEETETPLKKRLQALGKVLGIAALAICTVIFIVGVLYGKEIFEMFLTAVSLAVAAIPEGLPAIATIVLAIGVQRMVKRNAIVRRLPSVETLGSATVICSDKTGTLTQNRMTVEKVYYQNGLRSVAEADIDEDNSELFRLLVMTGVLCNDSKLKEMEGEITVLGDPTETALVDLGLKTGMNKDTLETGQPRVDEVPFDSKRKLMTTVHALENRYRVYTKGAVEELLNISDSILLDGRVVKLEEHHRTSILETNESMARDAMRVLGMAYKDIDALASGSGEAAYEDGLVFIGMMGMIDPPRPEAREAVSLCKRAGIKPIMITGDHGVTAVAIARDLGILTGDEEAVTGAQLEDISDGELEERVRHISVYARVSPEHKVRIVKAWQNQGQIVAMTGDGVNDAPALKIADIGAAMGIVGTDVAKEASDMVLTDDNFATVVAAVEEGRTIFANILKAIQFLLSCNVGEILTLFVATMLNWHEPLLPIHILWVNLVTDSLPALALGVDPAEKNIMDRKPRDPERNIFDKGMIRRIVYQGIMVGALTLTAFVIGSQRNLEAGRTMAFTVLALSQLVHSFNMRSNRQSVFKKGFASNKYLLGAVAISALLVFIVLEVPFLASVFKLTVLNIKEWTAVGLLALAPIAVVEAAKLLKLNTAAEE